MIRLRVNPLAPDPGTLSIAAETVVRGGVVALPTDTLYGLAVDPRLEAAVASLYRVKRRDADQPLSVMAANEAQVEQCIGPLPDVARRLARRFWPGPLTLVIEAAPELAAALHSPTGHVAVRVPAHAIAREVASRAGFVVTATSANRSGFPPAATPDEVAVALGGLVDLLLDAGPAPGGAPSTVIDASGPVPVLLRAGAVTWERVLESISST